MIFKDTKPNSMTIQDITGLTSFSRILHKFKAAYARCVRHKDKGRTCVFEREKWRRRIRRRRNRSREREAETERQKQRDEGR